MGRALQIGGRLKRSYLLSRRSGDRVVRREGGYRRVNRRACGAASLREHDERGRVGFLDAHGFGRSTSYYLQTQSRLYDAKAIAGVAYGYQFPDRRPLPHGKFNGGEAGANSVLRSLGYTVVDTKPDTVDGERSWRLAVRDHIRAVHGDRAIEPGTLRDFGVYGGAQGIWVDSARTRSLDERGITVGVLHTGLHYADDLTPEGVLYHYPHTKRPRARDQAEIAATKAAAEHRVPVFVISHPTPHAVRRHVHLGWVEGWDDNSELFLITFAASAPSELLDADHSDQREFRLTGNRSAVRAAMSGVRPGQSRFKLQVFQRYGSRCPLSGVTVPEMLEAAHLVPGPRFCGVIKLGATAKSLASAAGCSSAPRPLHRTTDTLCNRCSASYTCSMAKLHHFEACPRCGQEATLRQRDPAR